MSGRRDPQPDAAAPEPAAPARSASRLPTRAKAAAGAVTGVIALLVSGTTLFDWFEGRIDDPPAPPPRTIDANIVGADLELRNERLIDYLEETRQSSRGLSTFQKREPGLRFAVRVRLMGYEGVEIPLQWQMQDDRASRRLPRYTHVPLSLRPENQDHRRTVPVWVPYPPRPGRYTVRFSLLDKKRQPLDVITSAPFTVRTLPAT